MANEMNRQSRDLPYPFLGRNYDPVLPAPAGAAGFLGRATIELFVLRAPTKLQDSPMPCRIALRRS